LELAKVISVVIYIWSHNIFMVLDYHSNLLIMTVEQHRANTIQLYESFLSEKEELMPFQVLLFERAILLLKAGHKPTKVEDWVVKMENNWIHFKTK